MRIFLCRFINNYGVLGVLDRLHGTDAQFRESRAYQRHILLLGFVPVSHQFPDNQKGKGTHDK
jgi:fatty acid hydroxylase domain-containing protein 2